MTAPRRPRSVAAVLLAPGAGSSSDHATLVALEAGLAPLAVRRMDFPYRLAGRRAPDRPPVLLQAVRDEFEACCAACGTTPDQVVLGGRSMGGRICSMLAAGDGVGAGLLLISYPLHPPGRPDRLRVEHFPDLGLPCLFISGDRDPFGSPEELEAATAAIPGPVTHHWIAGGRHGLDGHDDEVVEVAARWLGLRRRGARRG